MSVWTLIDRDTRIGFRKIRGRREQIESHPRNSPPEHPNTWLMPTDCTQLAANQEFKKASRDMRKPLLKTHQAEEAAHLDNLKDLYVITTKRVGAKH
jgi:hypothetical protein